VRYDSKAHIVVDMKKRLSIALNNALAWSRHGDMKIWRRKVARPYVFVKA
jgi:hypothetical protein